MRGEVFWQAQAACARPGVDPELFYADDLDAKLQALAICQRCPVRAPCAAAALTRRESFGIWGGMTVTERQRRLGRRPPGRVA